MSLATTFIVAGQKRPFTGPEQVLDYVRRYTHRVTISNNRLVSIHDGRLRFRWKDYRKGNRQRTVGLESGEFTRRFLIHVLADGFHRIRYYGFLANHHRAQKLARCRELLRMAPANQGLSRRPTTVIASIAPAPEERFSPKRFFANRTFHSDIAQATAVRRRFRADLRAMSGSREIHLSQNSPAPLECTQAQGLYRELEGDNHRLSGVKVPRSSWTKKMTSHDVSAALRAWQMRLGSDRVLGTAQAAQRYCSDTSGEGRTAIAALLIKERAEIVIALEIARLHRIPLYPISTGKNWGYGGASPILDGCVILDLSGMKRIIELNQELGLVTIEPGVTQGQLREYLDRYAPNFMVPTTGAGPHCSLIGNALERGYGITPHADHFGAVTALEAILPDGRLYRSALAEAGAEGVDKIFKFGLGPYLDGLFAQGSIGIVTQMTIALAPRPERVEAFFFGISAEAKLEATVLTIRGILRAVGGVTGAINLMNAERVLAMTIPYPTGLVSSEGVLPQNVVMDLARRHEVRPWMGVGALYGDPNVVKAARQIVRQLLKPVADRVVFLTPERSALLGRLFRSVPGLRGSRPAKLLLAIDQALDVMVGRPSEVALRLAYWRAGKPPPTGPLDPARDGCGLIWYSPLVPMRAEAVKNYVEMVREICRGHGIEPLITLTSLSDRCFDSTVPLLFDRADTVQRARAEACFDALFENGRHQGLMPYRLGTKAMNRVTSTPSPFWDLVRTVKSAIDPDGLVAPGRYAPVSET